MTKYVKVNINKLVALMQERAIDQRYFSEISGVNRATINFLVNGKLERVTCRTARAFAAALEIPVSELIESEV